MSVSIKISKSELSESLKFLRNGLLRKDRNHTNTQLEMELYQSRGLFRIKGAEYEVPLESDRFTKVTMPLIVMWEVLKSLQTEELQLTIEEHKLTSNTGIDLHHKKITCMHPEELATPELPLNYNHGHVLKLSRDYDEEQQKRMGLREEVLEAEKELEKALNVTKKALEKFNISNKDVEEFVNTKIYGA